MSYTVPETMAGNLGGGIPAPNGLSLYASSFSDLNALLARPGSNLANDISSAASGVLTGLVFNGSPAELISNVAQAGLQLEASRHFEREMEHHAHEQQYKEKEWRKDNEVLTEVTRKTEPHEGILSSMVAEVAAGGEAYKESPAREPLKGHSLASSGVEVSMLGASMSEFFSGGALHMPTSHLGTGTSAVASPAVGGISQGMVLAA